MAGKLIEACDNRQTGIRRWLNNMLAMDHFTLAPASSDASFRRYFRVTAGEESYIVMDAPPDKEDCKPFVDIAARLGDAGVTVPKVLGQDLEQGFLLLTDLGRHLYLDKIDPQCADALYRDAIDALILMQLKTNTAGLPLFDETLFRQEMQLFPDWLLSRHLGLQSHSHYQGMLAVIFDVLSCTALQQAQTFVHRDYHSRNLLWQGQGQGVKGNPGIIDFQDAVVGPVSYDLVSLLKDCYIKWPTVQIQRWVGYYFEQAQAKGLLAGYRLEYFQREFDLMGVQRHLKASGIFARLYHRDGKPGYLVDIPRTLSYISDMENKYSELKGLIELIQQDVLPRLNEKGSL